ncbi:MAG: RimK domain-containing protein ATP-grasp [Kofleriaceae bacterium]
MILLWGLGSDQPLAAVRTELAKLGRTAVMIDQRAVLETTVELEIDTEPRGALEWSGIRVDLERVKAAYMRPYDPFGVPALARTAPDAPERRHALAAYEVLRLWGDASPARVVNRLAAMSSNNSKPYQAELIRHAGFSIPATLLTTDPEAVIAFAARHGELVYKSISGTRSIVARLDVMRRDELERVTACPTQFQALVPGIDYRVHVVGDEVFVCELVADSVDYRYAHAVDRRAATIPDEQARACVELARVLELSVAGIDLRRTPAGEWFCFEVNPSPAYSWFDLEGRIATSIARHLAAA